jgi:hypothetical protein
MIGASPAGSLLYGGGLGSQAAAGNTGESEEERRRRLLAQQQARLSPAGTMLTNGYTSPAAGYGVAFGG